MEESSASCEETHQPEQKHDCCGHKYSNNFTVNNELNDFELIV